MNKDKPELKGKKTGGISRRELLKLGGVAGAAVGLAAAAGAGFASGRDYDSYTGWERYTHGEGMFFNREPFRVDKPTYDVVGEQTRIPYVEYLFGRLGLMGQIMYAREGEEPAWKPVMGVDAMPEPLKTFFKNNPEKLKVHLEAMEAGRKQRAEWPKYEDRYAIAEAFSFANSMQLRAGFPANPRKPPAEWDFRMNRGKTCEFISPKHASELIKKIAHVFGATLVGIARLNPAYVYAENVRGGERGAFDVPEHWKYAIVTATPHEWDQMYANPTYGTSYDAYARENIIAGKMEAFIQSIGYAARAHIPGASYDIAVTPIGIDAGLGELGRNGCMITPELGANARLSCVTTNLPMEVDRPIDIGVAKFCEKCKICADQCPSGAINTTDKPTHVVRGVKRWQNDETKCYKTWNSVATSHARGCRVCLAVCPYTRKNNWIHTLSREVDARDPSGLVSSGLLSMQKGLFEYPEKADDYLPPPDGHNANLHEAPDWMLTEKWFKVKKTW